MTLNDNLNEISDINIGFSKLEIGLKATLRVLKVCSKLEASSCYIGLEDFQFILCQVRNQ